VPELLDEKGSFRVLSQQVGLRPSRTGGVRIEAENVEVEGLGMLMWFIVMGMVELGE
jgi:hypothetical protein